jgi:hypothetical protein
MQARDRAQETATRRPETVRNRNLYGDMRNDPVNLNDPAGRSYGCWLTE